MKKTMLIGLIAASLMVTVNVYAQKNIPETAKKSISSTYPGVKDVKWEKEGANYEAGFMSGGKQLSIVLDAKGNILETETAISTNNLPAKAISYLKTKFGAGVKIAEAASIKKADGTEVFEAEVKGTDYLFDIKGNFIKSEKE
jgi:hypothetical protein